MAKITRLEDARALKELNAPLNTPVEDRTFSEDYSRHWLALMDAQTEFMLAMHEYSHGARAQSPGKWKLVRRKLAALDKAAARCVDFLVGLSGNVPDGAKLVFKTEQDQHEYALLGWFLAERAVPFIGYWREAIDAVEAGSTLTIAPGDIPRWTDE